MNNTAQLAMALGAFMLAQTRQLDAGGAAGPNQEGMKILLASDGSSLYSIVLAKEASRSEQRAARELQTFLERITSARLPILTDDHPMSGCEILLGDNAHLRNLGTNFEIEDLGDEGFVIRTVGPHLVIAGGRLRGTMYGVYAFLEEHLGCRWYTSTVSRIPRLQRVELEAIDDRQVPALEYREVFYFDALDADWSARNRLNSSMGRLTDAEGGKVTYYPFVHSFWTLIPPEEFFESHPEWFSLVDGQRTLVGRFKRTQLCLTNEAMIQTAIGRVKQWIQEHPEATIISVSQNDGPGGWCECERCAALEAEQGGAHSAPIIYFVNRIAEAIATDHPKVAIDTLAYSYSSQAPATLKPLPNVIIRLTTGACCSHAIGDTKCDKNANLRKAFEDWFRLTRRIYVWDYVTNFRQYLLPFPNYLTLQANMRYFVEHGVRGVFEQGSGDTLDSDMSKLKAFLIAKLLWNRDADLESLTDEFLEAYYGPAGEPIGLYLKALTEEVGGSDDHRLHMSPFEPSSDAGYLSPEMLTRAARWFEEAERLVEKDPALKLRVKTARLSIDYVKLQLAARLNAMARTEKGGEAIGQWFAEAMDSFFATAREAGITHMRESTRQESGMEDFRRLLEAGIQLREGTGSEIE